MKAVVLVGGEGTRLRPLTLSTPKQLLRVAEVPLIERVLGHLHRHGVDDVVLSLGYRPDAFLAAYPDGEVAGVKLTYAVEAEPLDTAGAILFAARTAGISKTFMVVNGDVLTDSDLGLLVDFHRHRDALATISLTPVEDPSRFGVVPTDEEGRVLAFVEKPAPGTEPTNEINAGTYVFEPDVLDLIAEGRRVSVERETFPQLVTSGRLFALCDDAYWLDAGTPAAFLAANDDLLGGRRAVEVAPGATSVDNRSWQIGTATISGEVGPHSLVGDGAVLGARSRLISSVAGTNCVIGEDAVVTNSVLLPGAEISSHSTVTGSIIGSGAVIGSDVTLENCVVGDHQKIQDGSRLHDERVPDAAAS